MPESLPASEHARPKARWASHPGWVSDADAALPLGEEVGFPFARSTRPQHSHLSKFLAETQFRAPQTQHVKWLKDCLVCAPAVMSCRGTYISQAGPSLRGLRTIFEARQADTRTEGGVHTGGTIGVHL